MWGLELTRDAGAGRAGRPRARRRRQPDGGDGRAAAAAARHHGGRGRRSARSARCGAGRRGSCRMKQPTRGRITLRTAGAADAKKLYALIHGEPRGRAPAAAHARRARPSTPTRFVVAVRGAQDRRLRRAGAAQPARRRSAIAGGRRARRAAAGVGVAIVDELRAARAARRLREALRVHARAALLHSHGLLDRAAPLAARRRCSPTA